LKETFLISDIRLPQYWLLHILNNLNYQYRDWSDVRRRDLLSDNIFSDISLNAQYQLSDIADIMFSVGAHIAHYLVIKFCCTVSATFIEREQKQTAWSWYNPTIRTSSHKILTNGRSRSCDLCRPM
jgi:hypothetical protein